MQDRVDKRYQQQSGQAAVELALVIPVLLLLAVGVVAVGQITQAKMSVSAVARDTARAGAITRSASAGVQRGQEVAAGYGLTNGSLQINIGGSFERGGTVHAVARYTHSFHDLPLLGWANVSVAGTHNEPVDLYRSFWDGE